jgi:tetratricopeptide (TPR) repeat protein
MATSTSSQPNPQAVQALINALNNGQLAQAESTAKDLIAKHANTFILHHVLALALDGQQKFAEAVTSYQNALKLQPNMPDLLFNLGIALTQLNRLDEATNAYAQAIRVQPGFFEAHGNLGTILQRQGKLEGAIESYQKGLKINPQDARARRCAIKAICQLRLKAIKKPFNCSPITPTRTIIWAKLCAILAIWMRL